jgi:hypothetical protein
LRSQRNDPTEASDTDLKQLMNASMALSPAAAKEMPRSGASATTPKPTLPGEAPTVPWTEDEVRAAKAAAILAQICGSFFLHASLIQATSACASGRVMVAHGSISTLGSLPMDLTTIGAGAPHRPSF